jgi:hypothetical protein
MVRGLVSVTVDLTQAGALSAAKLSNSPMLQEVLGRLQRIRSLDTVESKTFRQKLESASLCTVIYHPCGSCTWGAGEQGALVEYWTDDDQDDVHPDYTECEEC